MDILAVAARRRVSSCFHDTLQHGWRDRIFFVSTYGASFPQEKFKDLGRNGRARSRDGLSLRSRNLPDQGFRGTDGDAVITANAPIPSHHGGLFFHPIDDKTGTDQYTLATLGAFFRDESGRIPSTFQCLSPFRSVPDPFVAGVL